MQIDETHNRSQRTLTGMLTLISMMIAVAWLGGAPGLAQVVADGGQFQVNAYTTDDQRLAKVGIADDGTFVVAWESTEFTDLPSGGIVFRRFDSVGGPIGDDVAIPASAGTGRPQLAVAPAGNFVVSWVASFFSRPTVQLFDSGGGAVGGEFAVSTDEAVELALDMGESGDFVVAWSLNPSPGPSGPELGSIGIIQARRYASDGTAIGTDFEVARDSIIIGGQKVGVAADGSFLAVWSGGEPAGDDTSNTSVQGRLYDSSGQAGNTFQVNSFTTGFQRAASLDVDSTGRFVVVWESDDGVEERIRGQRYEASGNPLGGEFVIFDGGGDQSEPQVRVAPDDGFVVTWVDGASSSIQALRFDASGASTGLPVQVDELGAATSFNQSLAVGAFGEVVVAWASTNSAGNDDDRDSVQARRLLVPCDTGACLALFIDGFESGDTSAWTSSNP